MASGHPWIFASDVTDRGGAQPGDAVKVVDAASRTIGTAHYSSTSQICLRMLTEEVTAIDRDFLLGRIEAAAEYRQRVVSNTDAYRLIYSEADRLPGLIADRYGDYLVLQILDQGMDRLQTAITSILRERFTPRAIVLRADVPVRRKEDLPLDKRVLEGEIPKLVAIQMNGLRFHVDLLEGQKTGVYLDQRENYGAAARYARGKALDCFTSTGGFALHLARACESVEGVDSSAEALSVAAKNDDANGIANVEWRQANAFDLLASYAAAGRRFETVVLDPPAFAKSRGSLEGAMRGYKDINLRALRLLDAGGILVSCSCSHHLSEAELLEIIAAAALDSGRTLRVLERRTQAQDHPILLTVPETHYLKCLIFEVVSSRRR